MTDTPKDVAGQRDRSPAFPVIALEAALEKLAEFDAHYKRTAARPEKVGEAWDIKTKAYADRIAAALRYYGLLEYQGSGKDRSVIISENGRKYLRAQQDELKREIVKAAALRPKQIAKHWGDWGADRPADPACLDALMDEGFGEGGARDFLKVYDATITYAKLTDSDKASLVEGESEDESEASTVTQTQIQPEERTALHRSSPVLRPLPPGVLQEVFNLDEGPVTLAFPSELSEESYEELKAQLELFLRRAQRRARQRLGEKVIREVLASKKDEAAN
jgi:hypothetical protein